jgi:hypothetical protein
VFAPLVGSVSLEARQDYAQALVGQPSRRSAAYISADEPPIDANVCGYSLTVVPTSPMRDASLPTLFLASLAPLSPSKPRLVLSASGPHDILRLCRDVGIDLFVDEWSSNCASVGVGLDFCFPVPVRPDESATAPRRLASGKLDIGHNFFDLDFTQAFVPLSSSALARPVRAPKSTDETDDTPPHPFGPSEPTRAYVHHLLQSHEMTAHVILALHNSLVMHNFFSAIRRLLEDEDAGAFAREVDRFFETYEGGTPFSGGNYACVVAAQKELESVDTARGKGSLKLKALEESALDKLAN